MEKIDKKYILKLIFGYGYNAEISYVYHKITYLICKQRLSK